jgi:ribosomal protein L40E
MEQNEKPEYKATVPTFKPLDVDPKTGAALPTADQLEPEVSIAPVLGAPEGMSELGAEAGNVDKPCHMKKGGEVKKPVATEEPLTFRGLEFCDQCGAALAPGEQLAGFCRKCQVRERLRATTSRRVPRVPRSKHDLS